jgi:lipid A 3-O-deacylase
MKIFLKIIFTTAFCLTVSPTFILAADKNLIEEVDDKKMAKTSNGEVKKVAPDKKGIFSVAIENDLFTGTDHGYTNGVRFSYISPEEHMPAFVRNASSYLPMLNQEGTKRIGIAFGQSLFSPNNIREKNPPQPDFPYAGWLYGTLGLVSDSGGKYDNVALTLGMVGPASQGEPTQKFIHHLTNSPQPQGWKHQLKNEPGINLAYERKWRNIFEISPFGMGFDAIPHVGMNLGNINTSVATGITLRLGYDLPSDYGPPRIRPTLSGSDFFLPTKKLGGYLFTTFEIRAVARNIFLDGNTFQDSQHVDKRTMVKSMQFGATATYEDFRISYSNILITKEFKGQPYKNSYFGAVTLSYRF